MTTPNAAARSFVVVALIGGLALFTVTLLWIAEVITLPVFVGGLVVVALLEGTAIGLVVRRMRQAGPSADPGTGPDTTGPYRDLGYDPMDGLPSTGRSPEDR